MRFLQREAVIFLQNIIALHFYTGNTLYISFDNKDGANRKILYIISTVLVYAY